MYNINNLKNITFIDLVSEIKDGDTISKPYHRINGRKVNQDILGHIIQTCFPYGLRGQLNYGNSKNKYQLMLSYDLCTLWGGDLSIFQDFFKDALCKEMKIFSNQIADDQKHFEGNDKNHFIVLMQYKTNDEMLQDMISVVNFITDNLDTEKNRNN